MSADAKRTENYVKTGSGGSQRAPAVAPDLGAESVPSGAAARSDGGGGGERWAGKTGRSGGGRGIPADLRGKLGRPALTDPTWRTRPGASGRPQTRPTYGLPLGCAGQPGRLG